MIWEKGTWKIFEIKKSLQIWWKLVNSEVQETQQASSRLNKGKTTARHISKELMKRKSEK